MNRSTICLFLLILCITYLILFSHNNVKNSSSIELNGCDNCVADTNKNINVYVLFYANWCIHCKQFKPLWDKILKENKNKSILCVAINDVNIRHIKSQNKIEHMMQNIIDDISQQNDENYNDYYSELENIVNKIYSDIDIRGFPTIYKITKNSAKEISRVDFLKKFNYNI